MRQRRRRLASHSSKSAPTKSDEASEGAADKPKDGIDPLFLSDPDDAIVRRCV